MNKHCTILFNSCIVDKSTWLQNELAIEIDSLNQYCMLCKICNKQVTFSGEKLTSTPGDQSPIC